MCRTDDGAASPRLNTAAPSCYAYSSVLLAYSIRPPAAILLLTRLRLLCVLLLHIYVLLLPGVGFAAIWFFRASRRLLLHEHRRLRRFPSALTTLLLPFFSLAPASRTVTAAFCIFLLLPFDVHPGLAQLCVHVLPARSTPFGLDTGRGTWQHHLYLYLPASCSRFLVWWCRGSSVFANSCLGGTTFYAPLSILCYLRFGWVGGCLPLSCLLLAGFFAFSSSTRLHRPICRTRCCLLPDGRNRVLCIAYGYAGLRACRWCGVRFVRSGRTTAPCERDDGRRTTERTVHFLLLLSATLFYIVHKRTVYPLRCLVCVAAAIAIKRPPRRHRPSPGTRAFFYFSLRSSRWDGTPTAMTLIRGSFDMEKKSMVLLPWWRSCCLIMNARVLWFRVGCDTRSAGSSLLPCCCAWHSPPYAPLRTPHRALYSAPTVSSVLFVALSGILPRPRTYARRVVPATSTAGSFAVPARRMRLALAQPSGTPAPTCAGTTCPCCPFPTFPSTPYPPPFPWVCRDAVWR